MADFVLQLGSRPLTLSELRRVYAGPVKVRIDEAATRAIHEYPEYPHRYRWLAASLGQLGRVEEAKRALVKAVSIVPGSFDMYVRNRVPWFRPQDYAHMLDGLRKAGWEG